MSFQARWARFAARGAISPRKSKLGIASLAGLVLAAATAPASYAQTQFTDAGGSFLAHVRAICPQLNAGRTNPGASPAEQDLFLRCNGALNPTAATSSQANILDQYFGVQAVAAQSDGLNLGNRPTQAVAGRLDAMASQMKGRSTASLINSGKPIMVASLDQDSVGLLGGVRESRLDGFLSVGGFKGEQDTTSTELGFDEDGYWVAAGLDYQFSDAFGAGVAVGYVDGSADFDGIGGEASGGSLDTKAWSVSAYGVFSPTEKLTVTGLFAAGSTDFDNARNISVIDQNGNPGGNGGQGAPAAINRQALGSTSADTYQATIGISYDAMTGPISITPHADLTYYKAEIDGYTESGAAGLNLRFDGQDVESLRLTAGATIAHDISMEWGTIQPYASAAAVWEMKDDAQQVLARYAAAERVAPASSFIITTNPADDLSFTVSVGAQFQWANGIRAFAEYGTVLGLDDVTYNALSFGLRKSF